MTEEIKFPKPILKWVGGKTQIINQVISRFPSKIRNYHEIFLGGGSVLLALLKMVQDGHIHVKRKIYAYDFNETLIHLYKNIQSNPSDVFDETEMLINEFNEIDGNVVNRKPENLSEACTSKESYFYWTRSLFNQLSQTEKNSTYGTALFIFLNKTCFRGVYRVGPNGFNVPYGNYNSPEILNLDHLMEIHELIQPVIFTSCSFEESISNAKKRDFCYMDPPYAQETSKSFVKYNKEGFGIDQHKSLFSMCNGLEDVKFMMSNSNVDIVKEYFPNTEYNIDVITAKRSINSKNPSSKTEEVIIRNFIKN